MINFFRKIFHSEKKLILVQILSANEGILRELKAMRADATGKETSIQEEVAKASKEIEGLTKMIHDMVEALSKYFKIEVEFMEKEAKKMDKRPTEHDHRF